MSLTGIDQIDTNESNVTHSHDIDTKNTRGNSGKTLNIVLLFIILLLVGLLAYLFFTDRLTVDIKDPAAKPEEQVENGEQVENKDKKDEVQVSSTTKSGKFHLEMGYPSSFLPAYRVCFSDVKDISLVYCFVDSGYSINEEDGTISYPDNPQEPANGYENTLSKGVGTLPVGEYTMEYKLLDDVDYYVWNPCVKSLNGSEVKDASLCSAYYKVLEKSYVEKDILNFKSSYINSYGGDPIVIKIEEGKETEIGQVASMPYINYNF